VDLRKKKIAIIISILCFLIVLGIGVIVMKIQKEATAMREQRTAYMEVNFTFQLASIERLVRRDMDIEAEGVYRSLPEVDIEVNRFGILVDTYLMLLMYELKTGNSLTYEMVVEYFGQEFEPDGSVRLHNNGNHPEINAFVEWMLEDYRWRFDWGDFVSAFVHVYANYSFDNRDNGFVSQPFESLSPQMLRELARAAIDPECYLPKMDLTSLQEAGY
jgi:hypothetical protein